MDSPYSPLEFRLLNDWQRDFPLVPAPFAHMARKLAVDEEAVLLALKRLQARGAISRVGAVFAPRSLGASTLAALAVPADRLEAVAAAVSAQPGVNHNYEREHRYNLWFVMAAPDAAQLGQRLETLEAAVGCPMITLPLVEEYHIDLGFDLGGGAKARSDGGRPQARPLGDGEKALATLLQPGVELSPRPFRTLAAQAGMAEEEVIGRIGRWLDEGTIKRFGVVVRHRELGYLANAMVVFDVPDAEVPPLGAALAREAGVTLCYRRRRQLPDWRYNLFCMVHGRSREEVAPVIDRLRGIVGHPGETLFSTRRFKQCGARYFGN